MDPKTYHNCEHRLHVTITSLRFQLQCSHRSWWGHHPRGSSMAESVSGLGVLVCKHWHAWIPFEIDGSSQVSWDSRRSTGPLDRRSHPLQGWRCFPAIGHMEVADSAEDPTFSKLLSVFDQLQSKGRKKKRVTLTQRLRSQKSPQILLVFWCSHSPPTSASTHFKEPLHSQCQDPTSRSFPGYEMAADSSQSVRGIENLAAWSPIRILKPNRF